jgi:hypothetical protein
VSSAGAWFQIEWPEEWIEFHITVEELLPIAVGMALWVREVSAVLVVVVADVNSGSSKCERVMHLVRSLFFLTASQLCPVLRCPVWVLVG